MNSEPPVPVGLRKTGQYTLQLIVTDVCTVNTQQICLFHKSFFVGAFLRVMGFNVWWGSVWFGLGFIFSPEYARLETDLMKITSL